MVIIFLSSIRLITNINWFITHTKPNGDHLPLRYTMYLYWWRQFKSIRWMYVAARVLNVRIIFKPKLNLSKKKFVPKKSVATINRSNYGEQFQRKAACACIQIFVFHTKSIKINYTNRINMYPMSVHNRKEHLLLRCIHSSQRNISCVNQSRTLQVAVLNCSSK